ncbi:MAG TPA: substrate-binding domain-containing protein [Solirubrobacterales bacterium]|nr:substrate-binding domain-containing protein [Solirubrobacterales bacterium]
MLGFGTKKGARNGVRAALLTGATVAALSVGGLGAGSAAAAPACNGSNIVGQGSSLQRVAQEKVWIPGFQGGICPGGPTVTYNSTGSGGGLKEWNHDGARGSINTAIHFIGTDDAPTAAQITNITKVAGGASLLTIPVAQTSIAFVANPPAGCEVEAITNKQLEQVFRGTLKTWSALDTAEGTCNSPITRVVRKDASGTTFQTKNYLARMFGGTLPCLGISWLEARAINNSTTGEPNTNWPETCEGTTLSTVEKPAATGGGAVVEKVNATAGSIGYAATPDAKAKNAKLILAVQNNGQVSAGEAEFASPIVGEEANCLTTQYTVPVGARQKAGEPATNVDWSQVFGAHPAAGGEAYPLCTLTYILAFRGYGSVPGATKFKFVNEVTVRDYVKEYITAAAGQAAMESNYYAPLPAAAESSKNVLGSAQFTAGKIKF